MVLDIIDPLLYAFEGILGGDVIDDDSNGGISDVVGNEGFKSFLTGRIPQLQADGLILEEDILGDEVDADGGSLSVERGTCSLPSKMS